MKEYSLTFLILLLLGVAQQPANIFPQPVSILLHPGNFILNGNTSTSFKINPEIISGVSFSEI